MMMALILGGLIALSAIALMVREVLLGPDTPNYPSAPFYVRLPMFAWMVALAYRAMEIFTLLAQGAVPVVTWGMLGATVAMTGYVVANAVNIARLRMRASTWRKFNRAVHLFQCGKRGQNEALGVLFLDGWTVAAPHETPDEMLGQPAEPSSAIH